MPKRVTIICKRKYCLLSSSIKAFLESREISATVVHRDSMNARDMKGKDLIIITGGDGTFLQVSHHIMDDTPVMGVNVDPRNSYGFYTGRNHVNLEKKILKTLAGNMSMQKLYRLKVVIGQKEIPYRVLNEVFYANQNPAQITYYKLNGEMQMSSGVIISTAAGSTAWAKSAGGTVLPLDSSNFQYVVREPYINKFPKSRHYKQVLDRGDELVIEDLMGDSFIAIDGAEVSYSLQKNQSLRISLADELLHAVM